MSTFRLIIHEIWFRRTNFLLMMMAIGFLKGKSAIRVHRDVSKVKGSMFGRSFWARGYCVSTVGLDEALIAQYIQDQEKHERVQDQNELTSN